jgi:hypothetical protein
MPDTYPKIEAEDLPVYGGARLRIECRFLDDADAPEDVSGLTFTSQWRPKATSDRAIDFTIDATDAVNGVIVLSMTATQTRSMGEDGVYDLAATVLGEPVYYIRQGTSWTLAVTRV